MLSQLDGSTERQTQSPAQTRVKSLKQSIISFPCSHNCCSVFQNPGFKNHRLLHGAGNWNRTPQQPGLTPSRTLPPTCPALLGSQGVLPEFCSLHCPRVPREITQLCIVHPGRLTGKLCCSLYPANMEEDQKVSRKGINGGVSRFLPPQFYPLLTVSFLS